MIINTKLTIKRPPKQVWDFFDNPDNLTKWITGLKSYHHLNGDPGTLGAYGLYEFQENGEVIEMTDEILARKEPEEFAIKLYHREIDMVINYTLFDEGNATTTLICSTEYKFKDLFWKAFCQLTRSKIQQRQNTNLVLLKKHIELEPVEKGS